MLSLSPRIRIFVYSLPTDMRKQFDGLYALVTQSMQQDVMTGDYFVFFNRRRNRCKLLYWDRDGLVVWAKRLERGRFQIPPPGQDANYIEIDPTMFSMILGGVDWQHAKRRKRYQATATETPSHAANPVVLNATSACA